MKVLNIDFLSDALECYIFLMEPSMTIKNIYFLAKKERKKNLVFRYKYLSIKSIYVYLRCKTAQDI